MTNSKLTKVGYELCDVEIVQAPISYIDHRAECNPYIKYKGMEDKEFYPVIVSPMGAVTNEKNYKTWLNEKFMCVVPRTVDIEKRLEIMYEAFSSFSLSEAEDVLTNLELGDKTAYVCIDLAQGTMNRLYNICKKLKGEFGSQIIIMTGNVANPDAYIYYADAGIDYLRACIGTGSRCTTAANVGIHYPTATLLDELRMQKEAYEERTGLAAPTKIIADGGIANFDDIQKCLALGADLVMSGSIFAKSWEACGNVGYMHPDNLNTADAIPEKFYFEKLEGLEKTLNDVLLKDYTKYAKEIEQVTESLIKMRKRKPYREYYGMSTKRAQKETGGSGNTTAEGISRPIPIEYNINKWADNMKSFLMSVMSYTDSLTLRDLAENTKLIVNLSGDRQYRK
jgi:IMP dehydrogenase/GMP reductase